MKLLLTSAGITNKTISSALQKLVNKPLSEISVAFIPTAANVEEGDKGWMINDLNNIQKLGVLSLDIVDISAVPEDVWLARLETSDIIVGGGGNTFHLMYWMEKVGFKDILQKLLETKVYVGISAGSMVCTHNIMLSQSEKLYSEEIGRLDNEIGLGFVPFHVRPHLNSPHFPKVTIPYLTELATEITEPIYALDDQSAIVVEDDKVKVISEGVWKKFN